MNPEEKFGEWRAETPISRADFMARCATAVEYDIAKKPREYREERYRDHLWYWAEYARDHSGLRTPV